MLTLRRPATTASLLAIALLMSGCEMSHPATEGASAPSFSAETLEGERIELSQLRGEVVLVNVWATWCWPCRREMPSFEALHRDLGDQGLRIVAVSIDKAGASGDIREFLDELGITFTVLHDPENRISTAFQAIGVPETYLIDARGVIRKRWIGRIDGRSDAVRAPIREALNERSVALARR
jgi:cytochrome c biogenesis protein CcmG, thiol:disulfide interchange protein DsbE